MPETQIEILQILSTHPGYLKKLEQIINSGILETKGDKCEIHFDMDSNIRKIYGPRLKLDIKS